MRCSRVAVRRSRSGSSGPSPSWRPTREAARKFARSSRAAAVLAGAVSFAVIAFLFLGQRNREAGLRSAEQAAMADSSKYAAVRADRARAQARRDSALLQLNIIKAIDEDRFVWPHIMEEISRALPIYTWLRVVNYTGTPQGVNPPAAIRQPPPDTGKAAGRKKRVEPTIPQDTIRIRLTGRTV